MERFIFCWQSGEKRVPGMLARREDLMDYGLVNCGGVFLVIAGVIESFSKRNEFDLFCFVCQKWHNEGFLAWNRCSSASLLRSIYFWQ